MEKEFVTYELAVKLKVLGFDGPCFGRYDGRGKNKGKIWYEMPNSGQDSIPVGDVLAPTFSQAFRWFREKYELFHSTNYQDDNSGPGSFDYEILDKRGKHQQDDDSPEFDTYEEAELACLTKLIEIVEQTKR